MYCNQRYRGDGEMEEMSRGHVMLIVRDNAGDRWIMSGDEVQRIGDGLGCHAYDKFDGHQPT